MAPEHRFDPYQQVWEAFQRSQTTVDGRHDTPDWRAREGLFAACVIRVPAQVLAPNLLALRRELARMPGVRPHPDHFLHIMLQELGFVVADPTRPDDIDGDRLEAFAQSAAELVSRVAPFAISVGGVNSFEDAVFLDVRPFEPLGQIHERLFDLAAVLHVPDYPYLPHCTVAHYDGTVATGELISGLAPWRDNVCGEFIVAEIELVTIDPRETYPELQSYAVIPLGG